MKPYFQDEAAGIAIYNADCREVFPVLPEASVRLLITDPPFYLPARISTSRKSWPRSLSELAIMNRYFADTFGECERLLNYNAAFYTFCDGTSYAVFLSCLYALFDRTQVIVWDKGKGGMGNGWRHSVELIIHGAFNNTQYAEGFRRNVLSFPVVHSDSRLHASEKPVELLLALMNAHEPGLILDPYMGSGTTLDAAKRLGRKAIGIDIEERNCEQAAKRLAQSVLQFEGVA